jgi:hypothetical protein
MKQFISQIATATNQSIAPYSILFFRVAFGCLMVFSLTRFILKGWVQTLYLDPGFHFTYSGFSWVQPFPGVWMTLFLVALIVLAVCISLGLYYRVATVGFFLGFTYIELIDKSLYLNHYYAISLFAFLLCLLPLHRYGSIDVLRKPSLKWASFPAWMLWLLRFQIGIIYFSAALAKFKADWLVHAQPLKIWLRSSGHLPLIGSVLEMPETAYLFSWFGLLYDLFIPFLLVWPRTRVLGYVGVLSFHIMTSVLFEIGVFPWVMMTLTLVFFSPDWPLRFKWLGEKLNAVHIPKVPHPYLPPQWMRALLIAFIMFQCLWPNRHLVYPGNMLWNEDGFRFAWHVMLMEKNGMIQFEVVQPKTGKVWRVLPNEHLSEIQERYMSTQLDMIVTFAHYLKEVFKEKGINDVEIYADSYVSLNGRRSLRYVKPDVNLLSDKPFFHSEWLMPDPPPIN